MKLMRKGLMTILALAVAAVGCQKDDFGSGNRPAVKMQTVKLSAGMQTDETRASLSSEDGTFSWQENDQISVLATDGKFYTLTLTEGAETKYAEFEGSIPEGYVLTGVAMYPAIIADATENTVFDASTDKLSYTLPSEYTWVEGCANVPMIAQLDEGAAEASFKQIGSVVRFTFNGLPANAKVVFTAKNLAVTGGFEIDVAKAGEASIVAKAQEGTNSTVTVNYSAAEAGASHEFNIPLPTGKYSEYSVEVFNAAGESLVSKTYADEKELTRAKLLMMKPLDAGPIVISEVWPFFVDARVLWHKFAGATGYAIYIDDATEPVIVDGTEEDGLMRELFGGNFAHGSSHKVAVAKVVDGEVAETTKSDYVEFTTGQITQLTRNTGTSFVSVGWDDVAIANGTIYRDGKWNCIKKDDEVNNDTVRGYRVQLFDSEDTTKEPIYELVPFDGQTTFMGAFDVSSWLGRISDTNILIPTALSFGWLEPGKDYYFRVQTLDEPVDFDLSKGNFNPELTADAPYVVSSARGGSAYSNLVKLSTDKEHVAEENEIFHEGFDDMMLNNDLVNWAPGVVPQLVKQPTSNADFKVAAAAAYPEFIKTSASERKWTAQTFNTTLGASQFGMAKTFGDYNMNEYLNENAGSLEGWSMRSGSEDNTMYPGFGFIRIGSTGTGANSAGVNTKPIYSDKLAYDKATKCIITVKTCGIMTTRYNPDFKIRFALFRAANEFGLLEQVGTSTEYSMNTCAGYSANEGVNTNGSTYTHVYDWYEITHEAYLRNGDIIRISKPAGSKNKHSCGHLAVGEIKVVVVPGDTQDIEAAEDAEITRFYGTAPDNTDYDVWGMNGKMPVTFWMGPPALDAMNVDNLTDDEIANIKTTYFDPIVEAGYNLIETTNPYPNSMKKILEWCSAAGVKLLDKSIQSISYDGNVSAQAAAHAERIVQYANDAAYGGAYVGPDEPGVCSFADIDLVNDAYAGVSANKAHVVNLLPSYAASAQLSYGASKSCSGIGHTHTTISSYETYVRTFADQVSVNCMMFDHYCLQKLNKDSNAAKRRGLVKSKQYYDLDLFRHVSLEKKIPYILITHGRPQWDAGYRYSNAVDSETGEFTNPIITVEKPTVDVYNEQRWLVWSQLALGSKGVSYFCYWSPAGFAGGPFSWTYDGIKTRMYDILKNINSEIQPIGSILMTCHADGAMMTNPVDNFVLYENNGLGLSSYGPVLGLLKGNEEDVVAGCFRDASTGEYKVLVTHQGPATNDQEAATASIAGLKIDTAMATKVKLHTVKVPEGKIGASETIVTEQTIENGLLTLTIPDGAAVLVEFPETANVTYN